LLIASQVDNHIPWHVALNLQLINFFLLLEKVNLQLINFLLLLDKGIHIYCSMGSALIFVLMHPGGHEEYRGFVPLVKSSWFLRIFLNSCAS